MIDENTPHKVFKTFDMIHQDKVELKSFMTINSSGAHIALNVYSNSVKGRLKNKLSITLNATVNKDADPVETFKKFLSWLDKLVKIADNNDCMTFCAHLSVIMKKPVDKAEPDHRNLNDGYTVKEVVFLD